MLAGLVLAVLYALYKWGLAFVAGWESFRIAFLTDQLSQIPAGISSSKWEIERSTIQFEAWLFVVGLGIIALAIGIVAYHVIMARIQRKRIVEADRQRRELGRREQQGFEAGQRNERSLVYSAIIHAFKPKVTLPQIPEGCKREFYIRVRLAHPVAIPTEDRRIHFSDIPNSVVFWGAIGAPHYDQVVGDPRRLAMLDVVYTLDDRPTIGYGE